MRGILSAAGYVPYRRLARADIAAFMGSGGGKGTRAVASHDEDTTTLGVEAARLALRSAPGAAPTPSGSPPRSPPTWTRRTPPRWRPPCGCRATSAPTTSAARCARAWAALLAALRGGGTTLVVAADAARRAAHERRRGRRRRRRRGRAGRRRARACWPSWWRPPRPRTSSPTAGARPGDRVSKLWEERFGENRYLALGPGRPRPRPRSRPGWRPATSGGWWSRACTGAPCPG